MAIAMFLRPSIFLRRPAARLCERPGSAFASLLPVGSKPYTAAAACIQRCLSLLPGRMPLSAAGILVKKLVYRSSLPYSISVIRHALSLGLSFNCKGHRSFLGLLVESGQYLKAEALFTTDSALAITAPYDDSTLRIMLRCYAKLDKLLEAKIQLARLFKIDPFPLHVGGDVLASAFSDQGQFFEAHSVFFSCIDTGVRALHIECLCCHGYLKTAHHIFEILSGMGVQPTVYFCRSLVYGFWLKDKTFTADRMLREMEHFELPPDLTMCITVMKKYCDDGNMTCAFDLFEWMKKSKVCPKSDFTTTIYSMLIHGFLNVGELKFASTLFLEMLDLGFVPDRLLILSILNFVRTYNKVDYACVFLDMMVKMEMDHVPGSFMTLISALYTGNEQNMADKWFGVMMNASLTHEDQAECKNQ